MTAKRYQSQKTRGTEGFGYVAMNGDKICKYVRHEDEVDIIKSLENEIADSIMFHHRFPTSTPNIIESAHPIKVSHPELDYDYYGIHNGIITNDEVLKEGHEKLGYVYTTLIKSYFTTQGGTDYTYPDKWNDSEALVIELARYIEGKTKKIFVEGSIAVVVLQVDKETGRVVAMYYGRNEGNPLKIERTKNFFTLTSEGNGIEIPADILFRYDYHTEDITTDVVKIGIYALQRYDCGYDTSRRTYHGGERLGIAGDGTLAENDFDYNEVYDDDMYWELVAKRDELDRKLTTARMADDYDTMSILEDLIADVDDELAELETGYGYNDF